MSLSIQTVDEHVGVAVEAAGEVGFFPLNVTSLAIEALKKLDLNKKKEGDHVLPDIVKIGKQTLNGFSEYHRSIFVETSNWSSQVKEGVKNLLSYLFVPLSFCRIGQAFESVISEKMVGNTAQTVAFAALQVFHLIPYAIILGTVLGTLFLYVHAPVALISTLAGSLLVIQVYFTWQVAEAAKNAKQELDDLKKLLIIENVAQDTLRGFTTWVANTPFGVSVTNSTQWIQSHRWEIGGLAGAATLYWWLSK